MLLRHPRPKVTLSLTPLIDVVFILLVFFMLASQFAEWRKISLVPAVASGASQQNGESHTLHILNSGEAMLNGSKAQEIGSLVHVLVSKAGRPPVYVSTDTDVTMQALVDVVEQLTAEGFNDLHMLSEAESNPR